MSALARLFQAEQVKMRKSWPMLTAILAPSCQAAFLGVLFWFSGSRLRMFKPGFRFWLELNYVAWNLVVMPVAVALLCELSWEQEREARAWNLLLIQPQSRYAHYLVKFFMHLCLFLAAQVLFALLLAAGGCILRLQRDLLMGPFPLAILVRFAGYSALATVAVAAFQTWLSMRVPSLWAALAAALAGSWLASHWLGGSPLIQFLPWGLAGQMAIVFERWRVLPWAYSPGSLLAAAVLVVLGTVDFVRHLSAPA
jgi:hypothetical protein